MEHPCAARCPELAHCAFRLLRYGYATFHVITMWDICSSAAFRQASSPKEDDMGQIQAPEQPVSPEEAKEKVKEKGMQVREQATSRAREQVQQRASTAGQQLQSFSQTVRRTGAELRTQGQEGQAALRDQIGMRSEQLAGYLSNADPDQLLNDARQYGSRALQFVKQQPWLIAPVGIGAGLLASRMRSGGGSQES